jgi:hypothetical protein
MMRLVDPQHAIAITGDIDLIDAARALLDAPIGCQRQAEELEQQHAIHAVVADEHDRILRVALEQQT